MQRRYITRSYIILQIFKLTFQLMKHFTLLEYAQSE